MKRSLPKQRFEQLLKPHFNALYTAARRMTLSTVDAEDLVQEVCLKAFMRMDELEGIDYQRAWLLKVMYNKFIDTQRVSLRSPVDQADTGADSTDPDEYSIDRWQPDDAVDREIRIARILMAMKRLGREQAALVALRDIEGLSIAELQEVTGMPKGTIKSHLHRTRAKLGRLLSSDSTLRPNLKAIGGSNEL
jgi:RNA polymerase sigma factor (sigma-70 family)